MRFIWKQSPPSLIAPLHSPTLLDPFNRVRVPGTPGSRVVQIHILKHFQTLGWEVELDQFEAHTPIGLTNFTNIIVTRDFSDASLFGRKDHNRLVIAAHYDSKIHPEGFIGAIDSAVPCAVMMYVAQSLDKLLVSGAKSRYSGLQFMFLDGEEAFEEWTDEDSIYGAKHLADTLFKKNQIGDIGHFILLDLLGSPDPVIPCLYEKTEKLFSQLRNLQSRMIEHSLLNSQTSFFSSRKLFKLAPFIQDDHVPFLHHGVPVMHIIPPSFPSVWHTIDDDFEHLHSPTVEDWAAIFAIFCAEALHLKPTHKSEL